MTRRLRALLPLLLALGAGAPRAQTAAMVELHHRSAESLITVLRPLVAPATLAGAGMQVQVQAAAPDLQRVMRLVQESDRPPQPLRVTFSDAPVPDERSEAAQPHGSRTLSTGRALPPDSYGNGQALATRGGARPEPVDVLEGQALPVSMPVPQSLWFGYKAGKGAGNAGASVAPAAGAAASTGAGGVVHFDSVAQVTARIWIAGEAVAVTLEPRVAGSVDAGAGSAPRRAVVHGRLGQWIALADSAPDAPGMSGAEGGVSWIRVEAAPQPGSP